MTEAELPAAIVAGLIAEGVEEVAVHIVLFEAFGEDLHGLLTVVAAVDADDIEAVVENGLAVGLAEEPFRVSIEDGFAGLAEIEAADDTDVLSVSLLQDGAEKIDTRG